MKNRILEKIKKLIQKQKSAKELGSINEAEAFAIKIQDLLLKYNISLTDEDLKSEEHEIIEEILSMRVKSVSKKSGYKIMYSIAKYNFCRVYMIKNTEYMQIIGLKNNVEICKSLYEICIQIYKKRGKDLFLLNDTYEKGLDSYLREFLVGCAVGLGRKLKNERERATKSELSTTALILRNDKAVGDFVNSKYTITNAKQSRDYSGEAYDKGYQTGLFTDINKKLQS